MGLPDGFRRTIGDIGQWLGLLACIGGIVTEIHYAADMWHYLITIGAIVWGVATKVKYYDIVERRRR